MLVSLYCWGSLADAAVGSGERLLLAFGLTRDELNSVLLRYRGWAFRPGKIALARNESAVEVSERGGSEVDGKGVGGRKVTQCVSDVRPVGRVQNAVRFGELDFVAA